ncbi:unnamed protein product [Rotaria sp. Silwood2]|nr:unnamed protein product [Rotaria sp. Silwood2]
MAKDDDSGDELQFRIKVYLEANRMYFLVVTTHSDSVTGNFTISAVGPAVISFNSSIPSTTTAEPTTPVVSSSFDGQLVRDGLYFSRPENDTEPQFYYYPFRLSVSVAGTYIFQSGSTMDTVDYFYNTSFDPFNIATNMMAKDDDSGGHLQFRIEAYLESNQTYVLVVTTHWELVTGNFSITAIGPSSVGSK